MSSSEDSPDFIDLERGLPVTPEDVEALRRLRAGVPMTFSEYLAWLSSQPSPSFEQLKARRGPRGEPFVLDE
jgi:hypothetical protein